jgi:serine/threonine protein phosphatase 1
MKSDYPWITRYFEYNRYGRDFVAGDIHGEFAVLENALVSINFDVKTDRLFCVGDLIDRGPQSSRIIEFLNFHWFHSIAGNHEWMLYNCYDDRDRRRSLWYPNGGGWWEGLSVKTRHDVIESIRTRPHALITVKTAVGDVGLVHALTYPFYTWPEFCQKISADRVIQQWALWERDYQAFADKMVSGIDLIFCGHTPLNQIHKFSSFINIDSGCGHPPSHWLTEPALTIVELSEPLIFRRFPSAGI